MSRAIQTGLLAFAVCMAGMLAGCSRSMSSDPQPRIKLAEALRTSTGGGSAAGPSVAKSTTTGWGTLKGRFVYNGTPPAAGKLDAGKDPQVCGTSVPNQSLVVDASTKGIANVVVYSRTKLGRVFDDGKKAAGPTLFDQKQCLFLSHVAAVKTKTELLIKNSDPISHNTNMSPAGNESMNPLLPPGGEVQYKFLKQLTTPAEVTCSIHPWMKAYILARDDQYFAVSAADGSFEIANLPAGDEIEFQVWHEKANSGLQAKPGWTKGRFKLTLTADKTEDLQTIEVPASAFQ